MKNSPIFDMMFGMSGINPFGNPYKLEKYLKDKYGDNGVLEDEVFEVTKGDYKTVVICKFNKDGVLVSTASTCNLIEPSYIMKVLKEDLIEAIEKEDFERAGEVQKKINMLRDYEDKGKPTI